MKNLDSIIEGAVVAGELEAGVNPDKVAAKSSLGSGAIAVLAAKKSDRKKSTKAPRWSQEEDDFLIKSLGVLTEQEIADRLGRTLIAVHLRWTRDLNATAPSKGSDILTTNQIANGLGLDSKSVHLMFDRGIIIGYKMPSEFRKIRLVRRVTLLRFITNPLNWIYFDIDRVDNTPLVLNRGWGSHDKKFWAHARKLVMKRKKLWTDEWWSPGQVANYHNLPNAAAVNNHVRKGTLPAIRWGNWHILKSHATDPDLRFKQGKEKSEECMSSWPEISAFMVLAEAVGLTCHEIGILMNWAGERVSYYLRGFHKKVLIPGIIKEHNLSIYYDKKTGKTAAHWLMYQKRFPYLARLIRSPRLQARLTQVEKKCLTMAIKRSHKYEGMNA